MATGESQLFRAQIGALVAPYVSSVGDWEELDKVRPIKGLGSVIRPSAPIPRGRIDRESLETKAVLDGQSTGPVFDVAGEVRAYRHGLRHR